MHKPHLTFWQIWNMSFGFLGIQFGWGRLGRRRPYFLAGAILSSLALIAMPNASTVWMAAGLLWILDASINISMEPFRAFVADKLPEEQRSTGFSMQSLFIGLGAVIASGLPWMMTNWFHITAAAGLLSVGFIHGMENRAWLHLSLGLVGIAWASILAMPYACWRARSAGENRRLHGHFQFLHRPARDRGGALFRQTDGQRPAQ
jgi:Na+/melibiose symporter-like transporter